jgi:hypothetical protein
LVQGEFDPMSPLEDGLELFEEIAGPKEFWVIEDGVHAGTINLSNMGNLRATPFMLDWLTDVAAGRTGKAGHRRVKWIAPEDGTGPYGD